MDVFPGSVVIRRSAGGIDPAKAAALDDVGGRARVVLAASTQKGADVALQVAALERSLAGARTVVGKLGGSITPWTAKKNQARAAATFKELEAHRADLAKSLTAVLAHDAEVVAVARDAVAQMEAVKAAAAAKDKALLAAVEEQAAAVAAAAASQARCEEAERLLAERDALLVRKDLQIKEQKRKVEVLDVETGSKDVVVQCKDAEIARLEARIEAMAADKAATQAGMERLTKSKEGLVRKLDALQAEYQGTADIAEREIRRLKAELKKAQEATVAGVAAQEKQGAKALASHSKEHKTMQRRYEAARYLADGSKEALAAAKRQLDEALAGQAKAVEQAEAVGRRCAEAKAGREAASLELEMLQAEQAALHRQYLATGGADASASALRAAARGPQAAGSAWPRCAFTARGNGHCVLHNGACNGVDTNRLQALSYRSAAELEAVVRQQGLIVCTTCAAEAGF